MHLEVTSKFQREAITTPFTRDVDDTVPVVLYSRPYERFEIAELLQLELSANRNLVAPEPSPAVHGEAAPPRILLVSLGLGALAFALGFAGAFLLR